MSKPRHTSEHEKTEEALADRMKCLNVLSTSAMRLLEPMPNSEIFQYVSEQLKGIAGKAIVAVTEYIPSTSETVVRAIAGPDDKLEKVIHILGRSPIGMIFPVAEGTHERMVGGSLDRIEGGLYDLTFGHIPLPVCKQIEQELDLGDIHAMPFILGDDFVGTVAVITDRVEGLKKPDVIESLVNQVGLAAKRNRAEEALRESEEKLAKVFHSSTNLVAITRQDDGRIVDVNTAYIRASGLVAKDAIGRTALELGLWPSAEVREACLARLREAGRLRDFETNLLFKAGEITVLASCEPLEMNGEHHWLWEFRDVTERKKAEEALRRTNDMLSALINSSPLAIDTLDCNGNVTLWNPAAEAVFGWTEAEVLGRFLPIVPAEAKDEFLGYLSMVFAGETLRGKEVRRMGKGGSLVDLRVWAAPLRDCDGEVIGCVSVLDDMTERKQLKAQLRQSQRLEAVGRLAGGMAHEFKNLLMGISSYAEILQMNLGPDHPEFETANELLQCVDRAAKLAGKLQAFGRRQPLEIRPTDLNALVTESKGLLEHLLGEHIDIKLYLCPEPPVANVDPGQIEQVLTNLTINARDAMPRGGKLSIKTRVTSIDDLIIRQSHDLNQDRYVEISVTDTGSGISDDMVNQIFEPFFTTKGSDGRVGLGLSVTYGIVKQHKGFVEVKSAPGEGSSFLVYLPAAEHASVRDEQAAFQPKRGNETILLAEDEDIVRMPIKSLLEGYGYTVLAAGDGEEAIELFRDHADEIDLAVLDLIMPKAGGKHAWQIIKETKPDVKVLFISGNTPTAVHEDFMPPSDLPLLTKPFSVLNLATKIREILD